MNPTARMLGNLAILVLPTSAVGQLPALSDKWPIGVGTELMASAGASGVCATLANYYLGIADTAVSRAGTDYSPGSALPPHQELIHPISSSTWALLGALEYRYLPNEFRNSPSMEPDRNGTTRVSAGLSRHF